MKGSAFLLILMYEERKIKEDLQKGMWGRQLKQLFLSSIYTTFLWGVLAFHILRF